MNFLNKLVFSIGFLVVSSYVYADECELIPPVIDSNTGRFCCKAGGVIERECSEFTLNQCNYRGSPGTINICRIEFSSDKAPSKHFTHREESQVPLKKPRSESLKQTELVEACQNLGTEGTPTEVLSKVFLKLGAKSLSQAQQVCRRWHAVLRNGSHEQFHYEEEKSQYLAQKSKISEGDRKKAQLKAAIKSGPQEKLTFLLKKYGLSKDHEDDLRILVSALDEAIKNRNFEAVKILHNHGASPFINPNQVKKPPGQPQKTFSVDPLKTAIEVNNCDALKYLLERMEHSDTPFVQARLARALVTAASLGNHVAIEYLLGAGARLRERPIHYRENPVNTAVKNGQGVTVQFLLDKGGELDGWSLIDAAEVSNLEITRQALKKGISPSVRNHQGETALHVAKDPILAQLLIESGASLDALDDMGRTPLHSAAARGARSMVKTLIRAGANPNSTDQVGSTPLHLAAKLCPKEQRVEIVHKLLLKGAQVNARDNAGMTPLMLALSAENYDPKTVRLFIEKGADIHTPNNSGKTPLMFALSAKSPDREAIWYLLRNGTNIHTQDASGMTPLLEALSAERYDPNIVWHLLKNGVNIRVHTPRGENPLMLAAMQGDAQLVTYFLSQEFNPNEAANAEEDGEEDLNETKPGPTALHLAAKKGHLEVIRVLLGAKADIDALDSKNLSPLSYALEAITDNDRKDHAKYWNVVLFLIQNGAHVEDKDACGRSALFHAISSQNPMIVEFFLKKGLDPNEVVDFSVKFIDWEGSTLLHYAAFNRNKEVIQLLLRAGAKKDVKSGRRPFLPVHMLTVSPDQQQLTDEAELKELRELLKP